MKNDMLSPTCAAQWNSEEQARIDADIEAYRKADAAPALDIPAGTPGRAEQTKHAFRFGAHLFNFNRLGSHEASERRKSLWDMLFHSATDAFRETKCVRIHGHPLVRSENGIEKSKEFSLSYARRPGPPMKRSLAATLVCLALASAQADLFRWQGPQGEFAAFGSASNWLNETQAADAAIPGENDTIQGLRHQAFDLGGATFRIRGWDSTGDWSRYSMAFTNGTLEATERVSTHSDTWDVHDGATLRFPEGSTYESSTWASAEDRIFVHSGGRFELFGSFRPYNHRTTVLPGGTAVFRPTPLAFPTGTRYATRLQNDGGTLRFPEGIAPVAGSGEDGFSFSIRQTDGILETGGPISDAGQPGVYALEIAGGTLRSTADVSFAFGTATVAPGAAVALEPAAGTCLDASALSFGAGATVRKTGEGILAVGARLPNALAVEAGTLRLMEPDAVYDLSGISFERGSTLEIAAPGIVLRAPGNSVADAAIAVALDWATNGQTVAVCPDEPFAERLVREASPGLPAGFLLAADGPVVRIRTLPTRIRRVIAPLSFEDGRETLRDNPGCGLAKGGWVDLPTNGVSVQNLAGNRSHMWCLRHFSKGYVYEGDEDLFRTNVSRTVGGRDIPLPPSALASIAGTLDTCRANGGTVVLRFAYTDDRYGGTECDDFDMVLRHVAQIGETVAAYPDVVLAVECGFIGAWGEMHTSRYADAEHGNQVLDAWLECLPPSIPLLVRAPKYVLWHFGQTTGDGFFANIESFDTNDLSRIGLFNDGYIGSWSDVGTWGDSARSAHLSREQGRNLLARNPRLPYGGEFGIVDRDYFNGDSGAAWRLFDRTRWNMVEEWYDTHLTYLRTIEREDMTVYRELESRAFTTDGFAFEGMPDLHEYDGTGLRKFCHDHMGARFVVRDLDVPAAGIVPGGSETLSATVENTGFGMLAFPTRCDLVFRKGTVSISVPAIASTAFEDLRPKETRTIGFLYTWPELVTGDWDVLLRIRVPLADETGGEPLPRRAFRIANAGTWDEGLRAQRLCTIRVAPETTGGIPYAWLLEHGLADPDATTDGFEEAAARDEDADGYANGAEYVAGTDPCDPESRLRATLSFNEAGQPVVTPDPPLPEGRAYTVESTDALNPPAWRADEGSGPIPDARFYRIRIRMP